MYFYHPDHLGSTSYVTDERGQKSEYLGYFAFGETWVQQGGNAASREVAYQYTAKELDQETGLYYYGARYYDPRTSVWASTDPVLDQYLDGKRNEGVHHPMNLALYSQSYLNPVRYHDPDGNTPWGLIIGVAVEVGFQAYQGKWSGDLTGKQIFNNVKDIGIAAGAGALTGGYSAVKAAQAISGAMKTGTAIAKSAGMGAATGAASPILSDASLLGGDGISGDTAVKVGIGIVSGGLVAGVGGVAANQTTSALNKMAGKGGVGNHIATTTADAMRGTITGAKIGTSTGSSVATNLSDMAVGTTSKVIEQKLTQETP